ncbi:MAG TPA: T9SS type A sorting domain-containing protein [Bacteroidia bacterium]
MKKLLPLLLLLGQACIAQVPAFPGAYGWGAASIGGRGGIVIEVTNLNDSGPGSFRDAVSTSGARTIVFRVGGIIDLLSEIQLTNPYVYIAAQTAPGDGIVLRNFPLAIFSHDVIVRGLRIRIGESFPNSNPDNRDCITIEGGAYNVIIDHCSFSWGLDENTSILDSGTNSVTYQWCIMAEGLYKSIHPKGAHSMGLLIGYDASKTSTHHNLFAHNADRNALIARKTDHEFVNNVVYDWLFPNNLLEQGQQLKVDIYGNYYKPLSYSPYPEIPFALDFDSSTTFGSRLFIQNNFLSPNEYFLTPSQISSFGGDSIIFSNTSLLSVPSTIPYQSPIAAYDTVLAWAGAIHPQRDTVDKRIIKSVMDSTGGIIDCVNPFPVLIDSGNVISATDSSLTFSELTHPIKFSPDTRQIVITGGTGVGQVRNGVYSNVIDINNQVIEGFIDVNWTTRPDSTSTYKFYTTCTNNLGGWPVYNNGTPPTDSDNDGIPDSWELSHGMNPNNYADHNNSTLCTGYTDLEVYLNEFYTPCVMTTTADPTALSGKISIYPNPGSGTFTVDGVTVEQDAVIEDLLGNKMGSAHLAPGKNKMNFEGLANGIYFLRTGHAGVKIIIEK